MLWQIREAGEPTGPAAVVLHGWLGHGREWLPLLDGLPGHHRWIIPDLPGHHGPMAAGTWGFPEAIDELVTRLQDEHGLTQWHLVGYSMGGRLALYLAIHYPALVRSLLLESCQPGLSDPEARRDRAALDDQRAEELQTRGLEAFVRGWYKAPLFASLQAQPALLEETIRSRLRHDPTGVAAALSALSPGRQPDLWPHLKALAMPVHLMTGALDTKYTQIMGQMAAAIPDAQLTLHPQAGHNVHAEQPQAWRDHLGLLLARR